ncbi:MAG: GxxExxY protein [Planctomycetota bacterium]|nr:GxxExxY protein [Planctomycetota bacterium]
MKSIPEKHMVRKKQIFHKELSFEVVGCAYKVHRTLGPGFPEGVYHKALCYELINAEIPFESEKAIEVFHDGKICGEFRADLVVDNKIVLELKALEELNGNHISQAVSYLKATRLKLAILINFGTENLETQRVIL